MKLHATLPQPRQHLSHWGLCLRSRIWLFGGLLLVALLPAFTLAAESLPDHPVVKPITGSSLLPERSSREDFGSLKVNYAGEAGKQATAEGVAWKLVYQLSGMSGDEIKANFIAASKRIGGERYGLDRATRANFRIPTADGGLTWLYLVLRSGGVYELNIIDEAPLEVAVEFDAEGFSRELLEQGKVSVYGILFATDSDRLLPGSGAVLDVIAEALGSQPGLKLEIQGHTDATGTDARNSVLSQQRADSVRSALVLFGIAGETLSTRGYGASLPVATNDTEEGRALNRRVDFVLPGN